MTLEMHDSRVLEVGIDQQGVGFMLLHGYVYLSEHEWDGTGRSGWQNIRLRFAGMEMQGSACEPDFYIYDGELTANRTIYNNMIPSSVSNTRGDICLSMRVSDDFDLRTIRGSSISFQAEGEFLLETVWTEGEYANVP